MTLRFADVSDAPALLEIYSQYINTAVTFEYGLPSRLEFAGRIAEISALYPYLVCEEEGAPVGYAYAHRFKERAAYQWGAELSVYLDRSVTGRGLGGRAYLALIELLKLQGIRTVYGLVTLPNQASERLHERCGFVRAGIYRCAGYKCGAWHDLALFERAIGGYAPSPSPIIPARELPGESVSAILSERVTGP